MLTFTRWRHSYCHTPDYFIPVLCHAARARPRRPPRGLQRRDAQLSQLIAISEHRIFAIFSLPSSFSAAFLVPSVFRHYFIPLIITYFSFAISTVLSLSSLSRFRADAAFHFIFIFSFDAIFFITMRLFLRDFIFFISRRLLTASRRISDA